MIATAPGFRSWQHPLVWLPWLALAIGGTLLWKNQDVLGIFVKYPRNLFVPVSFWVGSALKWSVDVFQPFTRAVAAVLDVPLQLAVALFAKGFLTPGQEVVFPRISWLGIVGAMTLAGHSFGGWRVALVSFACFAYLALFGKWDSAMLTFASIVICVPVGVLAGVLAGIVAFRVPWFDDWFIRPSLDLAQTVPAFAYLIPVLLLFGSGPVPGLVATVIFAAPPMVRATKLALSQVPEELTSFADMAGCTRWQKLWRVMIPTARPLMMVGVNQVIMMTLNMVIIASMIGSGGLGFDVLLALRALKIGPALEAGMAIVALAIALDRMSAAAVVQRAASPLPPGTSFLRRHPYAVAAVAWIVVTTLLGMGIPMFRTVPADWTITTGSFWADLMKWTNVHFYDLIEGTKTWMVLSVLNPFKALLTALPWALVVSAAGLLGYQLSGWRLSLLVVLMLLFPLLCGLWEKTMVAVYLCSISALVAALAGIPVGALASRSTWANRIITVIIDTLQAIPLFVFVIPAVMLFGIGDVSAMIAIVLFAVAPAIRYANHGLGKVPPRLLEAATAMGCTPRQIFWRVRLPLAMPEIMLGINQTVLMALSMLIITAMIGTRDLGQEVFISLAKADGGRGIVAGICVAFLGIVADRLIVAGARRLRQRLGLPDE